MKKPILIIILIIILTISLFFIFEKYQEYKYENCMNECEKNSTCLESVYIERPSRLSNPTEKCIKDSFGECKNICVNKYK